MTRKNASQPQTHTTKQFRDYYLLFHGFDKIDKFPIFHKSIYSNKLSILHDIFRDHPEETTHVINREDDFAQRTALHIAALVGNLEGLELLIGKGADVNKTDKSGFTPLHYACAMTANIVKHQNHHQPYRQVQLATIQCLLKHGAKPDIISNTRKTTLHVLFDLYETGNATTAHDRNEDTSVINIINTLCEQKSKTAPIINTKDDMGWLALDVAVVARCPPAIASVLIADHKSSVNNFDNKGEYTLHKAAATGSVELLKLLIDHGADVNCVNNTNHSPIELCVCNQFHDCVQCLLQSGADPLIFDKKGRSTLSFSVYFNDLQTTKMLIDKINSLSATKASTRRKLPSTFLTPLHIAARHGDLNMAKLLIVQAESSDKDLKTATSLHTADPLGRTPFMEAAKANHVQLLDLFYVYQQSTNNNLCKKLINASDIEGNNSLHLAAQAGSLQALEWLVEHGAEVNKFNSHHQSPLVSACISGVWDSAVYLLQQKEVSCDVMTALQYIQRLHNMDQKDRHRLHEVELENKKLHKQIERLNERVKDLEQQLPKNEEPKKSETLSSLSVSIPTPTNSTPMTPQSVSSSVYSTTTRTTSTSSTPVDSSNDVTPVTPQSVKSVPTPSTPVDSSSRPSQKVSTPSDITVQQPVAPKQKEQKKTQTKEKKVRNDTKKKVEKKSRKEDEGMGEEIVIPTRSKMLVPEDDFQTVSSKKSPLSSREAFKSSAWTAILMDLEDTQHIAESGSGKKRRRKKKSTQKQ